jgi:hypothetical protein
VWLASAAGRWVLAVAVLGDSMILRGAAFAAALLAWTTISSDVLSRSGSDTQQVRPQRIVSC